jgi:hypothetical protein
MRSLEKSDEEFQTGNEDTDPVVNDNATYGNNDNARKRKNILHDINKSYTTFTNTKQAPKTMKTWSIATLATLIFLFSAIISNIFIFTHRQSIY